MSRIDAEPLPITDDRGRMATAGGCVDVAASDYLEITVKDGLADCVTVLMVVRRTDGTQHNAGLSSFTSEEWHDWIKPLYADRPRVTLTDHSTWTPRDRFIRHRQIPEHER